MPASLAVAPATVASVLAGAAGGGAAVRRDAPSRRTPTSDDPATSSSAPPRSTARTAKVEAAAEAPPPTPPAPSTPSPPSPRAAPTPPPGPSTSSRSAVNDDRQRRLHQPRVPPASTPSSSPRPPILTLVLWLLAVAKRAVRGVPLTTALSEAIGFLWLTVLASAFTPLILYTVVSATDGVTDVIAAGTGGPDRQVLRHLLRGAREGRRHRRRPDHADRRLAGLDPRRRRPLAGARHPGRPALRRRAARHRRLRGPRRQEHVGPRPPLGRHHDRGHPGQTGDRDRPRASPGALSADDGPDAFSAVVSGLAIILLAIFASAMIYRFVPGFGDEIAASRNNRLMQGAEAPGRRRHQLARRPRRPGHQDPQHPRRPATGGRRRRQRAPRPANPVSGGVAAHSSPPERRRRTVPAGRTAAPRTHARTAPRTGNQQQQQQPHGR